MILIEIGTGLIVGTGHGLILVAMMISLSAIVIAPFALIAILLQWAINPIKIKKKPKANYECGFIQKKEEK